jgi:hypothetical protein
LYSAQKCNARCIFALSQQKANACWLFQAVQAPLALLPNPKRATPVALFNLYPLNLRNNRGDRPPQHIFPGDYALDFSVQGDYIHYLALIFLFDFYPHLNFTAVP